MSALLEFVREHTQRLPAEGPTPEDAQDLVFFKVRAVGQPRSSALKALLAAHPGQFGEVDPFDGQEHSYIELGGWLGDQGTALDLMGLGAHLGLWQLLTPRAMLGPAAPAALVDQLAGKGLITVVARAPRGGDTG